MRIPLQQYARARHAPDFPLPDLHRHKSELAQASSAQDIQRLADRQGLPPAALRGVASFYDDLHEAARPRVCHGTSCELAGADKLHQHLSQQSSCGSVYCLGYCDRSPAVLLPDGRVAVECDKTHALPHATGKIDQPPPSIRSVARQSIITARIVRGDFSALDQAVSAGVYAELRRAVRMTPERLLGEVELSGERGRGGAAFPTGAKWRSAAQTPADRRYVIANGDEGDPGSFIDRVLMEQDPHAILEGMSICGRAIGAEEGIVFIRSEYPRALHKMDRAIEEATVAGFIGDNVLGTGRPFRVRAVAGLGSYVCGEETAMINAIEGLRGEVRLRPPYPAESGLFGKPTVVNNVETLVGIPWVIEHGASAFRGLGTAACAGTKAICLNHGFANPGIVELEFGMSLREVIQELGGGGKPGTRLAAVILGGPMGSILTPEQWDVPVCYAAMNDRGIGLGHGGLVAVPEGTDFGALLEHWLRFMQHESCGKCVPCRIGSERALDLVRHRDTSPDPATILRLLDTSAAASLCAFGQLMPAPARTLIERFGAQIFRGGAR